MGPTRASPPEGTDLSASPTHASAEEKTLAESEKNQESLPVSSSSNTSSDKKSPKEKTEKLTATGAEVPPSDRAESLELEAVLKELPEDERRIIQEQLDSPTVQVNFFSLYRYATTWDLVIIAISVICAIAGGAALPLFTLLMLLRILFGQLTTDFQGIYLGTVGYDEFHHQLVKNVLYFIYIGIGEFATIYIATVGFIYTGEHNTQKIREAYLHAILRQNIGYFDNIGAGEITTRITADTNLIQDGISEKVALTLAALATFVTAFVIAYIKYWKLALICSSSVVAIVLVMGGGSQFIIKYSKLSLESYAVGGSLAEEVISSIRTATAFGTQERLAQQYDKHLGVAEKWGARLQTIFALMLGGMFCIMYLNTGLGFWMGSRFVTNGDIQVGQVLTVLMATIISSFSLGNVAPNAQAFTSGVAAAAKIFSTIDRASPLDPTSEEGQKLDEVVGSIELRNVSHRYPSRPDVPVMKDVSLFIPAGKTTALVGPSGSGKSTIIGLVERFYNPIRGEVLLDGHNIQSLNLRWLRQHISLVSQEPILFATTIFENVRYGLLGTEFINESEEKQQQRIEQALEMANALDFVNALPEGIHTHVGERGLLLSGGQKQRIAIARAVVSDPKILLLDEATSALDTKSEGVVQAALDKAAEGRTTIVIAHRLSTIKTAHNIVVLVNGSIQEQGTHDQLIDSQGAYYRLVEAQRINEEKESKALTEGDAEEEAAALEEEEIERTTSRIKMSRTLSSTGSGLKPSLERETTRRSISSIVQSKKEAPKEVHYSLWTLIKFIYSFNKKETPFMLVGLVFACLAGGAQPTQSVLYSKSIVTLSQPPSQFAKLRHDASFWSLMFLMLGLVILLVHCTQGVMFAYSSEKLIRRARSQAFRTMLRQDITFFDNDENSTGALTSFLSTETKHLSGMSGANLGTLLNVTTTLCACCVIALAVGWKLALVCIATIPVLLGCGYWRFAVLAQFQERSKKAYESSASYACEATSAIRTVASLTREEDVLNTYRKQLEAQTKKSLFSVAKSSVLYAASQGLSFFCMALAFWYGGERFGKHEYTMFQFFLCFTEVIFGSQSAGTIFSFAPDMGKSKNAAIQFKKLFDRRPAIDVWSEDGQILDSAEGTVEFRDVHFRYPTRPEQPVLRGLNLTVKPGQYVALVGASGCGKSTTIALLERFYDPISGGVYIDGKNIASLNVNSYRQHLALVSQEPTLYQGTVRENILLGSNATNISEEDIIKACKNANIYDFILSLPDGFDTIVGSKGGMLSGGQKQRVAIARALLRDPKILLLDEATSALDSESEKVVQAALDAAARGRTTIAVAHRLSTIQKADVIYVFDQGKIVESGNHQELIRNKGRYYELVNLQSLGKTH
ncbi:ABC multidrug transporter Mdr1 [Talaromyces stipitatus ATCC 10500]|uniref:ABC multidrug transporter Mdr1 n=1 Tax=Talaromyces stipitatus (strain ATCC 10500 / CBS 375.48 / QM 6759 / NRRL 1006) TaxID=441959 RepID=B8MDQ1_TALSN|nr:ABC multidrug transporter Mdr1 [Talaromyces stipitatus ATCC 10500]EED18280.1 ABC multidrug transporter Mdr1 [Talaromyces stipitatus ATCC 10500]